MFKVCFPDSCPYLHSEKVLGHVAWHDSLSKTVLQGTLEGEKKLTMAFFFTLSKQDLSNFV